MPVVAFTFGAFGDVVALLQLAASVRKALSESTGASMEYQDLIMELDSFINVVNCVHRTLSLQGPDRHSPSVENALNVALATCSMLIGKLSGRIIGYRESLRKGGSNNMMLDSWRKIGWSLFAKNDLIDLRQRLAHQIEIMNTLLTLAQGHASYRAEESNHEQQEMIREMHQCLKAKPNGLGYTWEGAPSPGEESVLFTDMCGHTTTIPWEFCSSEKRIIDFQIFYFKDKPGREFFLLGQTELSLERPRRQGDRARIIVWLRMDICAKYATACPICQKAYPGVEVLIGFKGVCPQCQTWYRIEEQFSSDFTMKTFDQEREDFIAEKCGKPLTGKPAPSSPSEVMRRMGSNAFEESFMWGGDAIAALGFMRRITVRPVVAMIENGERGPFDFRHRISDVGGIFALFGLKFTKKDKLKVLNPGVAGHVEKKTYESKAFSKFLDKLETGPAPTTLSNLNSIPKAEGTKTTRRKHHARIVGTNPPPISLINETNVVVPGVIVKQRVNLGGSPPAHKSARNKE